MRDSDVRIIEIQPHFSDEQARTPFMFGNMVMETVILCHVRIRVENRRGNVADGWGAVFLAHMWAFRTRELSFEQKDVAMTKCVEAICKRFADSQEYFHPVDLFMQIEPELMSVAVSVRDQLNLSQPIPELAIMVCAAPIDAALHDAFGKVNGISSYDGYGSEFMTHDLSLYLGSAYRGKYISDYLKPHYDPTVPIFHTVGGLDKLLDSELDVDDVDDGYPNSLESWIRRDGVYCFKVKLRGTELDWDVDRMVSVYRIARDTLPTGHAIHLTADSNEQSEHPDYMVAYLDRFQAESSEAYDALLYIEQPTERDLSAHRFDMSELAQRKPVIIDESLTSLETYNVALELGWTGVALKTCKCQSIELLLAARAIEDGLTITVQDLTNPGIALLQSIGLTARLPYTGGLETNSRQYYPAISAPEAAVHPGITRINNGVASLSTLQGTGFGYQLDRINRPIFA